MHMPQMRRAAAKGDPIDAVTVTQYAGKTFGDEPTVE
jgi:hypothetical protein